MYNKFDNIYFVDVVLHILMNNIDRPQWKQAIKFMKDFHHVNRDVNFNTYL